MSVDFTQTSTPALVTQILTQCADGQTDELFWNLSVGKRIELLLGLAAGGETETFSFPFRCGSCSRELELELTLDEIAEQQMKSDGRPDVEITVGDEKIVLRKPRGIDQKNWQTLDFTDERAAQHEMIGSLVNFEKKSANFDDQVLGLIDEAMDEADPLVNFNCRVGCGECGAVNQFEVDLCDYALNELRRKQWRLLYSAHRLAAYYHWSENEIFAVPHWRRMQYLALISEEKTR